MSKARKWIHAAYRRSQRKMTYDYLLTGFAGRLRGGQVSNLEIAQAGGYLDYATPIMIITMDDQCPVVNHSL